MPLEQLGDRLQAQLAELVEWTRQLLRLEAWVTTFLHAFEPPLLWRWNLLVPTPLKEFGVLQKQTHHCLGSQELVWFL